MAGTSLFEQGKMIQIKQKKPTTKRIVETTKQYSSATTIHGISYISGDQISKLERFLWAVVVLLAFLLAMYQVVSLYNDWQNDPVVTTLNTVALPIEEIEFPAVTICPQGSRQEIIDLVLFRQLTEYIQNSTDNATALTEEEMTQKVAEFLSDVYPGAEGKPTMLTKMLTSDNPTVSMQNDAFLEKEEECDPSSNADMAKALNKKIKNETCPEGFEMKPGSKYCLHAARALMTYNEASQYCKERSGSSLFNPETSEDIELTSTFLHISGNIL